MVSIGRDGSGPTASVPEIIRSARPVGFASHVLPMKSTATLDSGRHKAHVPHNRCRLPREQRGARNAIRKGIVLNLVSHHHARGPAAQIGARAMWCGLSAYWRNLATGHDMRSGPNRYVRGSPRKKQDILYGF